MWLQHQSLFHHRHVLLAIPPPLNLPWVVHSLVGVLWRALRRRAFSTRGDAQGVADGKQQPPGVSPWAASATTSNAADDLERDTKPIAVGLYVEQYRAAEAQRRARSLEHLVGTLLEQQQALRADFDKQLAAMRLSNERMTEWQNQFMAAQRHAQRIPSPAGGASDTELQA